MLKLVYKYEEQWKNHDTDPESQPDPLTAQPSHFLSTVAMWGESWKIRFFLMPMLFC